MGAFDEDLEAINRHIMTTKIVNQSAVKLKDQWIKWYNDLGWYDRNVNAQETYDAARNRRNLFNLANTSSAAQKEAVRAVMLDGLSSEEMAGGVKRSDSTGMFQEEEKPLIPVGYKLAVGIAIVGTGLIFAYGLATTIPTAIAGLIASRRTVPRAPQ